MPVRAGCGRSAEISAGGAGNLYLLPDRLSEARSAGSGDADIGSLADATRPSRASASRSGRPGIAARRLRPLLRLGLQLGNALAIEADESGRSDTKREKGAGHAGI